ncbi:amidohydrolase [Streptomyces sp. NPDC001380]|uniref:amidohydrolase n=1 Tax=Streptomyces sp. NPDC001380 TaxID=3364566 RepID=UPI0036BF9981
MPVGGLAPRAVDDAADVIVRNARVHTGDPDRPQAEAVAIRDGVVTVVGHDADVAPHVGPGTRAVDALGRRVVPGLNDSHLHVIRGGLTYVLELRWDGVRSLRQAPAMLREQAARTPKGQWVRVAGGFSAEPFAERRLPTLAELNAAAPDTPVFVLHLYQSALLNRVAVEAAGFTRDTPDPRGGQTVRGRTGEPTGMLLAAPSALVLYSTLAKAPVLDGEHRKTSTRHFLRELNRFGLTSAVDAAGGFQNFPDDYGTITELAEAGQLTLRIAYHLFPQTAGQELDDLARWIGMVRPEDGDAWLRLNGAGENLVWAAADFENFAQPRPELGDGYAESFEKAVRLLMENGWGFRLHATYDETIRRDLAVFEKLAAEGLFPAGDRWLFDRADTVSRSSLDRIAVLGGAMSVQNRLSFQGEAFVRRYGPGPGARAPAGTHRAAPAGSVSPLRPARQRTAPVSRHSAGRKRRGGHVHPPPGGTGTAPGGTGTAPGGSSSKVRGSSHPRPTPRRYVSTRTSAACPASSSGSSAVARCRSWRSSAPAHPAGRSLRSRLSSAARRRKASTRSIRRARRSRIVSSACMRPSSTGHVRLTAMTPSA